MSLRLEMLQVARLAPGLLGEAAARVERFVRGQQTEDGGFLNRGGRSDLYYTSFAVDALTALRADLPAGLREYVASFGEGEGLDFVHLCCLGRLWAALGVEGGDGGRTERWLSRVETFRSEDGGYEASPGAPSGTVYGCLLGYAAYADHGRRPPRFERLANCLDSLRTVDGAWSNDALIRIGSVPAVAAAVTLCRHLRRAVPESTRRWLLGCYDVQGGFCAFPGAPMPDLLSTAVALHALEGGRQDFSAMRESCLDFIDTLWTNEGGFHGNWADDVLDVEYTYYGLLALGHLAL